MSSIPFGAVPSEVEFMLCVGIGKMLYPAFLRTGTARPYLCRINSKILQAAP
jgi:hypothetical protein